MFKKLLLIFAAIALFSAIPTLAQTTCKKGKFVGTYTLADPNFDVFGDGSAVHSYTYQLTFHSDGTVNRTWTGFPDYLVNLGTGTPSIGSWTCRADDKIVATMISATYFPVPAIDNPNTTEADVALQNHFRTTYLFSIVDDNTVKQITRRNRRYTAAQDPTDPNGGTLLALVTSDLDWKRVVASDADLLAP